MAGGLPGSRACTPSSPFGTATPPTITVPGGERSVSATVRSAEGASRDGVPVAVGLEEEEGGGRAVNWVGVPDKKRGPCYGETRENAYSGEEGRCVHRGLARAKKRRGIHANGRLEARESGRAVTRRKPEHCA